MAGGIRDWTGPASHWGTFLRTMILVLTSLLIGIGLGGFLPPQSGILYSLIGAYGVLAYVALTLTAHYRARHSRAIRQATTERRAEQRLDVESHRASQRP